MFAISVLILLAPTVALEGSGSDERRQTDPTCLLQKKAGEQQQLALQALPLGVYAYDHCYGQSCEISDASPLQGPASDLEGCRDYCWSVGRATFTHYSPSNVCKCGSESGSSYRLFTGAGTTTSQYFHFSYYNPRSQNLCQAQGKEACECQAITDPGPIGVMAEGLAKDGCALRCKNYPGFTYRERSWTPQCWCCASTRNLVSPSAGGTWSEYAVHGVPGSPDAPGYEDTPGSAAMEGDPHIKTLDGRHYTLLKQGTFSLWHFSGVDSEVSQDGQVKKVPVDWHIFSHYSGRHSFAKGLLLFDTSGGQKKVLELTSEDCTWRTRSSDEWKVVSEPTPGPYGSTEMLVSQKSGPKAHNHVRFNFNTPKGKKEVAVLSVSCRAHHSINLQMVMRNRADNRFVDGEFQMGRSDFSKLAMLQTSSSGDSQFAVEESWQSLGGSERAAEYLKMEEAEPTTLLSTPCTGEAEDAAKKVCSKHLGDSHQEQTLFEDCVFDLCHGAGETVAELAAELLASTRAIDDAM